MLHQIDERIAHIQNTIQQTSGAVSDLTQQLQATTQQLQTLHGHLNECVHWKQTLLGCKPETAQLKEQENGEVNHESSEEAA